MVAVWQDCPESVKLHLERGADIEIQDEMSDRRTCLHQAASAGSAQYIHTLAQSGADVNCRDENDSTPLTLPSEEGQTVPHWSAQNGHIKVAKALLTHAADLEPVDSDKALPLPWAGAEGHKDMEFFVSAESAK